MLNLSLYLPSLSLLFLISTHSLPSSHSLPIYLFLPLYLFLHLSLSLHSLLSSSSLTFTISSLAEVPECRLMIASTPHVIEHMIDAMLSSTYTYTCAQSVMCAIMCLSFSMETHQYLCRDSIVSSLLEMCEKIHRVPDYTSVAERQINRVLVE